MFSLHELTFFKDLAYKGRHWHEGCFRCAKCSRSLVEKPFAAKDEVLLCTECYSDEYSSKCFHCQKTIMPGKTTRGPLLRNGTTFSIITSWNNRATRSLTSRAALR